MSQDIADLRRDYRLLVLDRSDVEENPIEQFQKWFNHALNAKLTTEPNAMALATAGSDGKPSVRYVLLKGVDERGFIFYTNYESRKAKNLEQNPFASVCFHWAELERQVRIEGTVEKLPFSESEAYFHSRPYESQIGAMASHQSSVVQSREELEQTYAELLAKYKGKEVPMPDFWGGYIIKPNRVEFWQGRSGRMHDRIEYQKKSDEWHIQRLSP
jgi:pyridoxamine 5'-phosphate oxidase